MASLRERVRRKSFALRNRFIKQNPVAIGRLYEMMQTSPSGRQEVLDWATEFAGLLEENLLNRISKRDLALILAGIVSYRNTGVTPQVSHLSLIKAYENSSGLMQELLHKILFASYTAMGKSIKSEFFGEVSAKDTDAILAELDEQGYAVLPERLGEHWVDALLLEAGKLHYKLYDTDPDERETDNRKIDPLKPPKCVIAYANTADLASSSLLRSFSNDPWLVHLASRHMNTDVQPIDAQFWYSFPSKEASGNVAQLFHYDLDTLRWLKVFVYLTDVGAENGPHEFVPTSHKPGSKPQPLTVRDYARIDDHEIDKYCHQGRKTICGKRGTVILGDTRCFHKGNVVNDKYRLIFSPIYAPSRIGYFHGK